MAGNKKKKDEMSLFNKAMEKVSRSFSGADELDEFQQMKAPRKRAAVPNTDTDAQADFITSGDDEIIAQMEREEAEMAGKKGGVLKVFDDLKEGGAPRENVEGVDLKAEKRKKKKKKKKLSPEDMSIPENINGTY